jgi:hypothetical protein
MFFSDRVLRFSSILEVVADGIPTAFNHLEAQRKGVMNRHALCGRQHRVFAIALPPKLIGKARTMDLSLDQV